MTFALGWKIGGLVYLAADTAVTVGYQQSDQTSHSAFGELHVVGHTRSTSAGMLKLLNLRTGVVAICGDVPLGRAIAETFKELLPHTSDAHEALRAAVANNVLHPGPTVQLLVGLATPQGPQLLSFNLEDSGDIAVHADDMLLQCGSISPTHTRMTADVIRKFRGLYAEPDRFLACTLAVLQSYGIRDNLMLDGVGGPFCGLWVSKEQVTWQKDILFVIHDGLEVRMHLVSSIVRDDVLVVRSAMSNRCEYFADTLATTDFEAWKDQWWDVTFEAVATGRFDFVVFLNSRHWVVTVLEMKGDLQSRYIRIEPQSGANDTEAFRLGFAISPHLSHAISQPTPDRGDGTIPFKFNWYPHSPVEGETQRN